MQGPGRVRKKKARLEIHLQLECPLPSVPSHTILHACNAMASSCSSTRSFSPDKPFVYQHCIMHPELQKLLESNFNMVQPTQVDEYRHKITAIFCFVTPPVKEELISSFPNLKVVGNSAVGYEHVDVQACFVRGVRIGYTPNVLNAATADMGWALLLATARHIVEGDKITRDPSTKEFDLNWLGFQVSGTTLGIIGMGRIGLEFAKRAMGFDVQLLYHNRHQCSREVEESVNARYVSTLDELLSQSDFVVLVAPSTTDTYHMISTRQFKAMKSTGIFVNIARGRLVDQDALVCALREGTIAGAGLDVTDPEPLPREHPLLTLHNVTLTPHTGSATLHTRAGMVQMTIDNIWAALRGEEMVNEVKNK